MGTSSTVVAGPTSSTVVAGPTSGSAVAGPTSGTAVSGPTSGSAVAGPSSSSLALTGASLDPLLAAYIAGGDLELFADLAALAAGTWNPDAWAAAYDFSGVPWEGTTPTNNTDTRRGALIGRKCFLCAEHWGPRVSHDLTYVGVDGTRHTYQVAAEHTVPGPTDIRVGTLNTEVDASITSYGVCTDPAVNQWMVSTRSRPITATTASQIAQLERISSITATTIFWDSVATYPTAAAARHTVAAARDSGDPLFRPKADKTLELVTVHTAPQGGWLHGAVAHLADIDAWLATQSTARLAQAGV